MNLRLKNKRKKVKKEIESKKKRLNEKQIPKTNECRTKEEIWNKKKQKNSKKTNIEQMKER